MGRPKRHINWYVTAAPSDYANGWWWVPSLRRWHRMVDESVHHLARSSHAHARTAKAAFRIAHRCPADVVHVVARIHRKWPNGYEKVWVIDRRVGGVG
ncbi:MAG: hypothetical protein EBT79_08605 [Actinobacteria bacterium]|nr:hypothetical protein [Actinomycetota bacterium]NBR67314.1 hypothetical protein [Actinomycetota bacterium]